MSALQQITVGVVCVGGAFLLGHFLNNQSAVNPTLDLIRATAPFQVETESSLLERNDSSVVLPNFRVPSSLDFEFDRSVSLPPPNQLAPAPAKPSVVDTRPFVNSNQELEIEVPDFSALASQFKGTSLELPTLGQMPIQGQSFDPQPATNPHSGAVELTTNNVNSDLAAGSLPPRSRSEKHVAPNPHVPQGADDRFPTIQLSIEPPGPDNNQRQTEPLLPLTHSLETSFRSEDFQPILRGDHSNSSSNRDQRDQPPTAQDRFVNDDQRSMKNSVLEIQPPQAQWTPTHPNAVISYNDPFPAPANRDRPSVNEIQQSQFSNAIGSGVFADSGPSRSEPTSLSGNGNWQTPANSDEEFGLDRWNVARNRPAANESSRTAPAFDEEPAASRTPFGLNEENRSRLTRLNLPSDEPTFPETRFQSYQIQTGDTLASISTKFYGKPDYYLDIYLANRDRLRNPASVPQGITLRIPIYD